LLGEKTIYFMPRKFNPAEKLVAIKKAIRIEKTF
jgi:hypothetical protein